MSNEPNLLTESNSNNKSENPLRVCGLYPRKSVNGKEYYSGHGKDGFYYTLIPIKYEKKNDPPFALYRSAEPVKKSVTTEIDRTTESIENEEPDTEKTSDDANMYGVYTDDQYDEVPW